MDYVDILICMTVIAIIILPIIYYKFFYSIIEKYLMRQQSVENTKQIKNIMKSLALSEDGKENTSN